MTAHKPWDPAGRKLVFMKDRRLAADARRDDPGGPRRREDEQDPNLPVDPADIPTGPPQPNLPPHPANVPYPGQVPTPPYPPPPRP